MADAKPSYPRYTNQSAFDAAIAHLRKQACPSMDDKMECLYRGPNGTMCAIGALIPDELYRPAFEGRPVSAFYDEDGSLHNVSGPIRELFANVNRGLLASMQTTMHDKVAGWPSDREQFLLDLEDAAQWVARTYNLTYTPPAPATEAA